jgi:hypothetical protein
MVISESRTTTLPSRGKPYSVYCFLLSDLLGKLLSSVQNAILKQFNVMDFFLNVI